ncbi:hypothetical protein D3C71_2044240 [compost metagenome]
MLATRVSWPAFRLYSARSIFTRSTRVALTTVGVLSGMAMPFSALITMLAGPSGSVPDWPYQLPVALASVMTTPAPALSS